MNCLKCLVVFLLFVGLDANVFAQSQDTLPKFSLRNAGNNRNIIGWVNNYPRVSQISIQRGFDSIGIYKTILTVADPKAIQNGFADTKAPNDRMFYRIFISFEGGSYFFTSAKRASFDSSRSIVETNQPFHQQTDPDIRNSGWTPSSFIYTNKEGYVFINLPDAKQRKYRVKFLEEDGSVLFELKNIKETALTLDKSNFYHAGWFNFELYNDEKLLEKNKFYLGKLF